MYTSTRRGPTRGAALLAVLQALLLLSALVLTPAAVIAQGEEPAASHAPVAETTGEAPAAEAPAPKAKAQDKDEPAPQKPQAKAEPKAAAEPTLSERGLTIRLYRQKVRVALGGRAIVSAWLCPANDKTPFGGQLKGDGKPGTRDDDCKRVRVKWSVADDAGARLSNSVGYRTRVTLMAKRQNKLTAKVGDLKRTTKIIVKQTPSKVRPNAPAVLAEIRANAKNTPQVEAQPRAEAPAQEPTEAPATDPIDEPTEAPATDPIDEPTEAPAEPTEAPAEPTEAPAEPTEAPAEPTEAPAADEPQPECDTDAIDGECAVETPAAEPAPAEATPAPQAEPTPAPKTEPKTQPSLNRELIIKPADVNVAVDARMRGLSPTGQCNRYSPQDGNAARTTWQGSPNTVWTAHGRGGSNCPSDLDLDSQSSLGFAPTDATSVPTGVPFNLGLFKHYNWPVNNADRYSTGNLDVAAFGLTFEFPWSWEETPNNCSGSGCSDDHVTFTGQVADEIVTIDGIEYRLVILGFTQEGLTCGDVPTGSIINNWRTVEREKNYACLWGQLAQVRDLAVTKVSIAGAPNASFGFSSTSNLNNSEWNGGNSWNLDIGQTYGPKTFLPSDEDVTITEDAKNGWTLDSIVCRDGNGDEITGYSRSGRTVTLDNVPDAKTQAEAPITCTFKNKPDTGFLTLEKTVVNDNGGTATEADFQGRIDGSDTAWDTRVELAVGTYTASEVMNVTGYTPSAWGTDCAANGSVTIQRDDDKTCSIVNNDQPASLVLAKTVINDNGGTAVASDWTLSAGANDVTGSAAGTEATDVAGTYALSESSLPGYTNTSITCDNSQGEVTEVTVGLGETVTCTFVNDDDPATIILRKIVEGGTASQADFDPYIDQDLVTWDQVIDIDPGTYSVSEVMNVDDYVALDWTGDCAADGSVTVNLGDALECSITNQYAELEIEKSATPDTYSAVGDEIVYTITATNTGVAPLTNVDITDDLIDGLPSWTCTIDGQEVAMPVAELASGESIVCTATYTIAEDDVTGSEPEGFVPNTACAVSDEAPEVCDEFVVNEIVIELVKTVAPAVLAEPGGIFTYTLTIDNESVVPVTITELVDDNSGLSPDWAANCAVLVGSTLGPDAPGTADEVSCTYTVERTVAGTYPNVAQTAAVDGNGRTATAQDHATVRVLRSELDIVKEASSYTYSEVGDEVIYTITATNIGDSTLTNVDISDSLIDGLGSWTCDPANPAATLAPGESIVCTATYVITQADIDAGEVFNQACVESDQIGPEEEVCDDVTIRDINVTIEKTADRTLIESGDEVTFTLVYSHDVPVTTSAIYAYTLTDNVFGNLFAAGNGAITDNTCAGGSGELLEPDTDYTCEFTAVLTGNPNNPHENTATIVVTDGASVQPRYADDSDDAFVGFAATNPTPLPTPSPTPDQSQRPTDMLLASDTIGPVDDGTGSGGMTSWAIWVLLSALLIVASGWVIRRQRFAEVRNR